MTPRQLFVRLAFRLRPAATPTAWGFVVAAWAALTGFLAVYLFRYGVNIPFQDEWYFTPVALGDEAVWPWAVARHNEHVYPVGRVVYWAVTRAAGDFRAAAYLTLALLSAAGLGLAAAARRVRGRSHPVDVLFPVLLLNWGHFENLLVPYQVVWSVPLAAEAAILWLVLRLPAAGVEKFPCGCCDSGRGVGGPPRRAAPASLRDLRGHSLWRPTLPLARTGVLVGLLLLVVLQGGGVGMAAVPAFALWLLAAGIALVRRGERWAGVAAAGLGMAAAAVTAATMLTAPRNAAAAPAAGLIGKAVVALHCLGSGLGTQITVRGLPVPWAGIVVLAGHVAAGLLLMRAAVARPGEWLRAAGVGCVLAANLTLAAGVGATRDPGYAPRYATPAALGLAGVVFAFVLYGPTLTRRWSVAAGLAAVIAAAWVLAENDRLGRHAGRLRRYHYQILATDAAAGMPPSYLGSKHADYQDFAFERFPTYVEPLVRHGVRPFGAVPPDPPFAERFLPDARAAFPPWEGPVPPPAAVVWSGPPRKLVGVRVRFTVPERESYLMLTVRWGDGKSACVHRRPAAGEHEALFWVNDVTTEIRVEQTSPGRGLTVTGVWLRESP